MVRKLASVFTALLIAVSLGLAGGNALAMSAAPAPGPGLHAMAAPAAAVSVSTLIPDFMVKADTYYNRKGYSSNHYEFTDKELTMLAIVIHLEVRGESYQAKLAVGNVVMNRVLSRGYPGDTIEEVVTRPNQFAYNPSTVPNAECRKAAWDVLHYETWVVPQNTYFFRATKSKANWGRHEYWKHVGATAFYQDVYAGRSNLDTVPEAMFKRTYKWPQYGCKPSARVRNMQIMLRGLGYKVTTDGWFGEGTKEALVKFQKSRGIAADGIAGPTTLKALINKYGVSKYVKLKK